MTIEILGRREDQRLELESKDALDDPGKIAREVVGLLNAGGGEVWIGVEEEGGVAVAVDPVPDPERAKARLLDFLGDTVDPSPTPTEISIEVVPPGAEPGVLVLTVQPSGEDSGRIPYAFRKRGGWHFARRVGARSHPMSRQEIFGRPVERGDDALERALDGLIGARQALQDQEESGLWLRLQPTRAIHIDPEDPLFERIVLDPSVTGNRPAGSHFARASREPRTSPGEIEWGLGSDSEGAVVRVEVTEHGVLAFWVPLAELARGGDEKELGPLPLLEYPISAFRIARVIYGGRLDVEDRITADLALFGIVGWGLRKGTPGSFFVENEIRRVEEPDLTWEPAVFTFGDVDEAPDRSGFRLVRRIYHAFGWRESDMPRQYDRETGRLILPE